MTSSQRTRATRRTAATAVLVLAGGLLVAGCGSSTPAATAAANSPAAATAPAASNASTDAPASGTPASGAPASGAPASDGNTGSCGDGAVAPISAAVAGPTFVQVTIIGGCHQALIETTLTKADVSAALDICDAAAAVGYVDGISSITVYATDGQELAAGLKDAQCIGEP